MSDNIVAIYGEVPELVEKKSSEIVNQYLGQDKDDFNFVKFNMYENDLTPIIEETLTMPFSQIKGYCSKMPMCLLAKKVTKELNHSAEQLMEFIEKYDGENLIIFEVYQNKLDERKN